MDFKTKSYVVCKYFKFLNLESKTMVFNSNCNSFNRSALLNLYDKEISKIDKSLCISVRKI